MTQSAVPSVGTVISALFLVAGTCMGGGMLALPVSTGLSGFVPSITVMAFCWLAMTFSALLLMEVSLWMEEGVHIITMTSRILGPVGKAVAWLMYLFICYASLVAYTAAGGSQFSSFFELSREMGCIIFGLAFGSFIYFGSKLVGPVNAVLFMSMVVAYFALVAMGIDEVKAHLLWHRNWSTAIMALPLLLTSFSFQTMVPSLTPYLKKNAPRLRLAIIGGTTLTFAVYLIWQWLILGIVPNEGPNSLMDALVKGEPATSFLEHHVEGVAIVLIASYFALVALITSFFGIGLGLFDFLADGLHIKEKGWGQVVLGCLVVFPTIFFAIYFERAFVVALETTGGYGDAILNGIIPVLMVWIGRYHMGYQSSSPLPGGKVLLSILFVFFSFVLGYEIVSQLGLVDSILTVK